MWVVLALLFIACGVAALAFRALWIRRRTPTENDRSRQHDLTDPGDSPPLTDGDRRRSQRSTREP